VTLHLDARVAERGFDVRLEVAEGETLAILGPNGAGKSTLLSILAGLLRPDSGSARLDGESLFDLDRGQWLPPHQRGISLLAQEPLLFPHLSALENVAFGPRSAGRSRAEARASAHHWLAAVEAAELSASRPAQLSGGPLRPNRGCCCSTNRSPRSTSPSPPPCGACFERYSPVAPRSS